MSLIMIEGFDHHSDEYNLLNKGWVINGTSFLDIGSSFGRFGSEGLTCTNDLGTAKYLLPDTETTLYFGAAMYLASGVTPSPNAPFLTFKDESNTHQVRLYVNSGYGILAYSGGVTLGTSANNVITTYEWFYLEVKVTIGATTGEVVIKIDEEVILNLTSQDTKAGTDYIGSVELTCIPTDRPTYYDDLYIDDSQFHGDCRVKTYLPDSNGYTNFTPSAGTNYENVDETYPDSDTTYNESGDEGDKDSYGITTSFNGPILGLQVSNFTRKTGDLSVKTKDLVKTGGSDYLSTEEESLSTSYAYSVSMWENNPDTSSPWTESEINSAEFGLEITAMSTTTTTTTV